jgi:hypothetical protein
MISVFWVLVAFLGMRDGLENRQAKHKYGLFQYFYRDTKVTNVFITGGKIPLTNGVHKNPQDI